MTLYASGRQTVGLGPIVGSSALLIGSPKTHFCEPCGM